MSPGATLLLLLAGGAAPPALPADLLEAAVAYLLARPELAAAFGSAAWIWSDEAPRGSPIPGCALGDADEHADGWMDDGSYDDRGLLTLAVYATSKARARALGQLVEAALDDADLAFQAGTLLYLRRLHRWTEKDDVPGPGNADVWARRLAFETIVARDLGGGAAGGPGGAAGGGDFALGSADAFDAANGGQSVGVWVAPEGCAIVAASYADWTDLPDPANTWAPVLEQWRAGAFVATVASWTPAPRGAYTAAALTPAALALQAGDVLLAGVAPVGTPPRLVGPGFTITWAPA